MKIIAFSDLHRDVVAAQAVVDAAHDADVVIGAGDFATRGNGISDTFDVLRALRCPFVFVHGNHDDVAQMQALAQGWTGAHYLHGNGVIIDGVPFFGVGGETPFLTEAVWNVAQSEDDATTLLAMCPRDAILITHSPPLGHCDVQADGSHEGSAAIVRCVEARTPTHVLSGHIHNAWGQRSTIGSSRISNLGPAPVIFEY